LAEIQKRLTDECGLRLTYMEVKFLVSDLAVLPQDKEPAKPLELTAKPAAASPTPSAPQTATAPAAPVAPPPASAGKVSVSVDQLARPGALVSGMVTFSDGKRAAWYLDETGRLGLVAPEQGYRPPPADVPEFQAALERELARAGF
jgi:hypothetical protein